MRLQRSVLAAGFALALAACGQDEPTKATGPVTLKFSTPLFARTTTSSRDTSFVEVRVDGGPPIMAPIESLTNVARGDHEFEAHFDVDYLPSFFTQNIDPRRSTQVVELRRAGSCRIFAYDQEFCLDPRTGQAHNVIYWSQHRRIICPASDFGDFCSTRPDDFFVERNVAVGMNWPADSVPNSYITQGRLMIAATVGAGLPDAGKKIATALYTAGDYSPRERLQVSADSSRYTNVVWTDARHVPLFPNLEGFLGENDRATANFGLQVRTTYFQNPSFQDVLFIRFDVKNISTEPDYRRVNPLVPASGFTVNNVYLAPMIDADIGGAGSAGVEALDDAATLFPDLKLAAAYDFRFFVSTFAGTYQQQPGLVGLQLIDTDVAGTPKALLLSGNQVLDYRSLGDEAATHAAIAGGRDGSLGNCTSTPDMFNCTSELNNDVRLGWSVGPIAALAPGETRTVTVAIVMGHPKIGAYTPNSPVPPENGAITSTTRPIYAIAEQLRALAASIVSQRVPAP